MLKAKDIMTREVVTVSPDTPVRDVAKKLWEHRINGMPVIDEEGRLSGIVTEADLIDQNKKIHLPTAIYFLDSVLFLENPKKLEKELKKMAGTTASDICTKNVITVDEETSVEDIATLMAEKRINTIPVTRDGRLVGIIGRGDVIRSMAAS